MKGGRRCSLARQINHQLTEECDLPYPSSSLQLCTKKWQFHPLLSLATTVSAKLEEGDFRGAVRLACSEDSVTEANESTIAALRSKHPAPHPDSSMPPPPDSHEPEGGLVVSEGAVAHAIRSFPNGSAGGPDGLRPQQLLDLTSASAGMRRQRLLRALTAFTNLLLAGATPLDICPLFFGASLTALNKKVGGVRPIAVGCTLRRLVAKTASTAVLNVWVHCWPPCSWVTGRPGEPRQLHTLPGCTLLIYLLIMSSSSLTLKIHFTVLGETKLLRQQGSLLLKSSVLYTPAMPAPPPLLFAVLSCIPLRVSSKATLLVLYSAALSSIV